MCSIKIHFTLSFQFFRFILCNFSMFFLLVGILYLL